MCSQCFLEILSAYKIFEHENYNFRDLPPPFIVRHYYLGFVSYSSRQLKRIRRSQPQVFRAQLRSYLTDCLIDIMQSYIRGICKYLPILVG
jgi:hypothetical protein